MTTKSPGKARMTAAAATVPESEKEFFVYLGPSIRGLIQNGDIFKGGREKAMADAKPAIDRFPLIEKVLIPGAELYKVRVQIKTQGTALYAYNRKLQAQVAGLN